MTQEAPIVACATPWGYGAISLVRLSGSKLEPILRAVCGLMPPPRRPRRVRLRDAAGFFDEGLLLWMPGPASYTGEEVAEISCHGNPLLVERLIAACVAAGARPARPGEFTRRAVLHGKLDLCQAEAVLQTLEATSSVGLALADSGRQGAVSAKAAELRAELVDVAAELEAILDYPGEDLLFSTDNELRSRLQQVGTQARGIAQTWQAGHRAVQGARVALVGPVNAGKSSLFNALLGRNRAIVSAQPGTTRDVVESPLQLPELRILLCDTAGLRDTADPVEAEGVELARSLAAEVDLRLVVFPMHLPLSAEVVALLAEEGPRLVVGTHLDRVEQPPILPVDYLPVSSHGGLGIDRLKQEIVRALQGQPVEEAQLLLASQRQRDLFLRMANFAEEAAANLSFGGPAVAVEALYQAMAALDSLTGQDSREDVLDRLFQRFCVGK
ncbi:MAG TPA: tRNA uridine-5-carboxymethylaminomethyl(34) synthesis GTPase MnmE [Myxococcota bacterium]|nr:tRNA uridine-5-carboxymethylaminomethyl(34) synthesis GTPase MnmE [Myxococcota bacterium]